MSFESVLHRHRRTVLLGALALVLCGAYAAMHLPVALFPHVNFPRIAIVIDSGDRSAERMLIEVTVPVEEAIRSVPGVRSLRSRTSRGGAEVSVNFDWGRDMVVALLQVQAALAEKSASLPAGTGLSVRRMDPTVFPVLGYTLASDARSLVELRDIATLQVRPALSPISGVARIDVLGGAQDEIQVIADPGVLAAHGLSMQDLSAALAGANVIQATGRLEDHFKLYLVMADSGLRGAEDIEDLVLRSGASGLVRLRDIASVERRTTPLWTRVTADGHDAVIVQVYQQPEGNTVQIAADVAATLEGLKAALPADVRLANWYDQSQLVRVSAASLREAVLIGTALAALVLLVFLRNLKITLIALFMVPATLAATCLLLILLGQSINMMTLGGMAAAVGLIIDDAIVMIEHIIRRVRASAAGSRPTLPAAAEFTRPLIGASAATIIIHIPPAFLSGVTGEFFKALSLTIAVSLVVSFFAAWLVVPLAADRLLSVRDTGQRDGGPVFNVVLALYLGVVSLLLRRRWLVLLPVVAIIASGAFAYSRLSTGFMPTIDEGGFVLDYRSPAGTSLTETDRLLRQVETILQTTPEVDTYSRRTGLQLGGGLTEANEGDFFIRLKPVPRRAIAEVMDEVRDRIESSIPGLQIELIQLMEDLIGDLTAVPQPIEVLLRAEDQNALFGAAPRVAEAIAKIPGVVDVNDGRLVAGDALEVRVDAAKAAVEGLDAATATSIVTQALSGTLATQCQVFGDTPKVIGVRVWTPFRQRAIEEDLGELRIAAPDGHTVPLSRIASIVRVTGQPQIMRDDMRRTVAVTARISGSDLGSTVRRIHEALAEPGLLNPPGNGIHSAPVTYALGGLYAQQRDAFRGLLTVFASAVALVFLLLVFWYESIRIAVCVIITSLLALPGVAAGLWLTHTELNISSMMGLAMIVGSVTEVGIFLCSEFTSNGAPSSGDRSTSTRKRSNALIAASTGRLRPIVMTTLAAILSMLPLVVGLGEGAAMLRPLAVAIVSGLVMQLPLVLLVLPVLLSLARVNPASRAESSSAKSSFPSPPGALT